MSLPVWVLVGTAGGSAYTSQNFHLKEEKSAWDLLSRFRHQDDSPELNCPRCRLPVAGEATECPECGWDLREAYHRPDEVGAEPA